MNVYNNLAYGLKNRGIDKKDIDQKVNEAAKLLQISDYLERKPSMLSGGQRQRVAMGRAIVRNPKIFLFDEPLSNLDAKLRVDLRVELKLLHQRLKNTMIYVTHDQIEAMTLADRIAIMKDGKIMQLGTPDEIYNRPQNLYVADFIGSPSMNFFKGQLKDTKFTFGRLVLPMGSYNFKNKSKHSEAVIGIRPEHIITGELAKKATVTTNVKVKLVEPMGSDTLVYADLLDHQIRIRMEGNAVVKSGDILEIGIDLARASLFDSKTEQRI